MHDQDTRKAILQLHEKGHGKRAIARTLRISRNSVRRVLASGEAEVPPIHRESQFDDHIEMVRQLHLECGGNLVRVSEELERRGLLEHGYSALTRFCRREGIGVQPRKPAGQYSFLPGEEMQHDTSPHAVSLG